VSYAAVVSTSAVDELPRRAPGILITRMSKALNILLAKGDAQIISPELIDLYFTAAEIAEGGMVTISMHVDVGGASELFSAWLALRPDTEEGTLLQPSVLLPGMKPLAFRVKSLR
jgi:hypothetical protein